ncbi:sigma-54-dependent Fis family transcriptional regulator [bacterium]|nr:MAG: sigma-54-dependent Fis family transcriptional regulator [bacterium]
MAKLSILIVEDDPTARRLLGAHLDGHSVDFAPDAGSARRKLEAGGQDICFIDLNLGERDEVSGLNLIPLAARKGIYSVVMSGQDSDAVVEKAYSLGCDDFYAKGNEQSNVGTVLTRYMAKRHKADKDGVFEDRFVTQDPATQASIAEALKYAASELPLLVLGPSGTGKTSVARLLHDHSGRSGEFVAINCSAFTEDLLEAELFGFRKGAFTGAAESRKGKLLLADEGTLFLDEIGSMSLNMQAKLLKAIEERSFYPLGSDKPETSRFRVISATLEDLQGLLKAGKLRFDFFQRIHGLTVVLKPLAQRKDDVLPLMSFFARGGRRISFAPEAKDMLLRHDWPGNVREVRKFVELVAAGQEGRVSAEMVGRLLQTLAIEEGQGIVTEEQYRFALQHGLREAMARIVDAMIQRNLAENGGTKARVMSALKIDNRLLYKSLARQFRG